MIGAARRVAVTSRRHCLRACVFASHPVDGVQTAESTPLPAFRWPKRTVLVLGHEHTGIPMSILRVRASLAR